MPIGNMLAGGELQYVALQDEAGTWRILDTWHDDLKQVDADADISDDSPAVSVLSEGQFHALVKEAGRLGVLQNANHGINEAELAELDEGILKRDEDIQSLHDQITKLKEEKNQRAQNTPPTNDYELKEKAMNTILKLVSIQDITNLGDKE
tara:strand:+ start:847 stop:1299 length:453 start_codon:yes stop_codon:yes gene_type:complete